MTRTIFVLTTAALLAPAVPAHAQFGGLGKVMDKTNQAKAAKDKYDVRINEQQEKQIGQQISSKLCDRFGVVQDKAVTKYVSLVGTVLAKESSRPELDWKFIVLDTDGVNAFAAPGGIIHITRGALGLIKNEAQLAGVLGHEITHVTAKHTVHALEADKGLSAGADSLSNGSLSQTLIAKMVEKGFQSVLDGQYSQANENDADAGGATLANKLGYNPAGLAEVLEKLDARNTGRDSRNGWFSSHPATAERIQKIRKQIAADKLTGSAVVEARYKDNVHYDAKAASAIAMDTSGAAGLASGDKKKDDGSNGDDKNAQQDPPKKKGFGLSSITASSKQANSGQQVASAGARGVASPDRDAVGGPIKTPLSVTITPAELVAFKRGIVAS